MKEALKWIQTNYPNIDRRSHSMLLDAYMSGNIDGYTRGIKFYADRRKQNLSI